MTIGEVLGLLSAEFPDITVSKIRFLEAEGLIEPERTPSGYRKFAPADAERLRFILAAQRDHYLPLRVIKEHLDAADRGLEPPPLAGRRRAPRSLVAADSTAEENAEVRLTRRQLMDAAGIDADALTDLEEFGLVRRNGGHYDRDALTIARAAAALRSFGFEARHLRAVKGAADREVGLIEAAVAPAMRQRSPGARERAAETAREIAALSLKLHAALVSTGLREGLDP
ncbi:transcriptional regulator FtsR [Actinoallomurus rhizosphaericola]|uniref:transcriptional regulator FtsR n=1 Tax=Actinoallomurus rhizosphaericola TaxID=2952536 RepID=UPI002093B0F4|nr:MerR family transcriptional regulator [Actinoallomurus rhizosphaericola]MCO5995204.1 MerR family transcriptional regulator [Actinoallomurus rhizosphaericola]